MKGRVLIAGASFAGLATAYWMNRLGYRVTVVEIAPGLKQGGTPVNLRGATVGIVERMGLLEQVRARRLRMAETRVQRDDGRFDTPEWAEQDGEEFEIERDVLLNLLFQAVRNDVTVLFGECIQRLHEHEGGVDVCFKSGQVGCFDLVFGCDGVRSALRNLWFGPDHLHWHFMQAYGSVTILDRLLLPEHESQMHTGPGRAVLLNAYNGKTDIILMFSSEQELTYDHRDKAQRKAILLEQFSSITWRNQDWLREVERSQDVYLDQLSQIKLARWTKGRVALVGDAAYCASPAAGTGGSLALDGAAALADAVAEYEGDYIQAFQQYNRAFRPFIEQVQADAVRFCALLLGTGSAASERN